LIILLKKQGDILDAGERAMECEMIDELMDDDVDIKNDDY